MSKAIAVVQIISVHWGKKSRGAPGSIKRNAIPEAVEMPLYKFALTDSEWIDHSLTFYEHEDFQNAHEAISVEKTLDSEEIRKYGCTYVQKHLQSLRVDWKYDWREAGMPLRATKTKDAFELELNQWGRVVYNGRFVSEEDGYNWWYEKIVVNVGLFMNPTADVFIATAPQVTIDKRRRLH
jgi:hypothetical protein